MALLKRLSGVVLRTSISACLLVLLFKRIDVQSVWAIIAGSNLFYILLAAGLTGFIYFLCLIRWQMVLGAAGIAYPLKRLLVPFLGGIFLNTFLPSTIGGDILRSAHVARDSDKPAGSVASVLIDRMSGFIGVVLVALAALVLGGRVIAFRQVVIAVAVLSLMLLAVVVVVFHRAVHLRVTRLLSGGKPGKIRLMLCQIITAMHGFRLQPDVLRRNILLSVFIQAISPVCYILVCSAVGGDVNPLHFFVLMPVIGAITLLPVSIGGIGLRDALIVYGFSRVGLSSQTALAMSLVITSITVVLACLSGIIYVFALHSRRIQPDQA